MGSPTRNLFNTTVVLAAIPAILYAAGTAYRHGYLSTLRLDENVLDRNFHQAVYQGFIAILSMGLGPLILLVAALILLSFFVIPLVVSEILGKYPSVAHRIADATAKLSSDSTIERQARSYTAMAVTILIGILGFLWLLVALENKGKSDATEIQGAMRSTTASEQSFIYVVRDENSYRLFFITCGLRNCAGYEPRSKRIIYYPQGWMSFSDPGPST